MNVDIQFNIIFFQIKKKHIRIIIEYLFNSNKIIMFGDKKTASFKERRTSKKQLFFVGEDIVKNINGIL